MSKKTHLHHHSGHASNGEMKEGIPEKSSLTGIGVSEEERSRLIRLRAYGLWEQAGKQDGDTAREQFWREAETEILASHARDE